MFGYQLTCIFCELIQVIVTITQNQLASHAQTVSFSGYLYFN